MRYVVITNEDGEPMFSDRLKVETLSIGEDGKVTIVASVEKED